MFYRRSARYGRLVAELWGEVDSHAVDWRLLDSALRDPGRAWFRGLSGERTPYEEPTRTQERCAGEPVVAEIAHLRAAEQFVPTRLRDPSASNLLAATSRTRARRGHLHSANAKGADSDERAISQRDQRYQWADRTGDHTCDCDRGARSRKAG